MERKYLGSGMVIVTTEGHICDLYKDNSQNFIIEMRHPERYISEDQDTKIIHELLKPQCIDTIYDFDDVSEIYQTRMIYSPSDEKYNNSIPERENLINTTKDHMYRILMIFGVPIKEHSRNADTIIDLFKTRPMIWMNYHTDKFIYNMVKYANLDIVHKACDDRYQATISEETDEKEK